jgi:ABC-type transport system involved in multi-copper enzyme maturation permease subunit
MKPLIGRKLLLLYIAFLVPIAWLASRFDPYQMDGDAMSYMDIGDLIRSHQWAGVVNGYWHPLYPALLALARSVTHANRMNELRAYYMLNYGIFLASVAAMLFFVTALEKLRRRMQPSDDQDLSGVPLLPLNALRLLGVCSLVITSQRELTMGKVRPDALLQTLMLLAFAMLLQALASESLIFAPLMGLFLGLAYLTKSFAFLIALLTIGMMMLFQGWIQRRRIGRVIVGGALALGAFAAIAAPYMTALSMQKHRLDFGDSGALAYAWLSAGTEKMHLEPWMTGSFGSSTVKLIHPEQQLLASPGIYSYRAEPYGTYPPWFDTTFFNERVVPHLNLHILVPRFARNMVLVIRYLFNHPEGWILLCLFLYLGARFRFAHWRQDAFWVPVVALGFAMMSIYGLVLIEERYVTFAYLCILLPAFAMLRLPHPQSKSSERGCLQFCAYALVVLMAFLALGESLRVALVERRNQSVAGIPGGWYSPSIFGAAKGLNALGLGLNSQPDEIACMGTIACVYDPYWMRVAHVRVLTEVYNPDAQHLLEEFEGLPNRQQVYDVLKAQGAKALVAYFDAGAMTGRTPASDGWVRLGETNFYAMPLNMTVPAQLPVTLPWGTSTE